MYTPPTTTHRPRSISRTLASALTVGVVLALPLAPLVGCAIISSDQHTSFTGNYVASDTLSKIIVGESTPEFTEAILGEPSSKTDLDDGSSIWRWDYTIRRESDGSLLLIFDGESSSSKKHSTYVHFKDGVVVKKWRS
ncbi:hypothetical protein MNBD_PLANCTO03-2011 [hydrothermal vent metagenome]|uniref:Outer membrane protein assembly factor BamE domain-containing protein n=1 Tax=hydrothermal vent metagenome TaxID=652676 RepID=A0A3B1DY55_9ZZZZ